MERDPARVGILVQARLSSRRLPGKVLRPLAGRPVLAHVVERCRRADGAALVAVITSAEPSDDPIAAWAAANGIGVFRGPLDDVAGRFVQAAEAFDLDAFVRITADSPLIDPRLIERGMELWRASGADLVTNVLRRTFPAGFSVEVLDKRRYAQAYGEMKTADDREHVTRLYYRHPQLFAIRSFEGALALGDRTLAVDTAEDLARLERIFAAMDQPACTYDCAAVCALADRLEALPAHPELQR